MIIDRYKCHLASLINDWINIGVYGIVCCVYIYQVVLNLFRLMTRFKVFCLIQNVYEFGIDLTPNQASTNKQ